jgi:hypothetical protein
MKTSVPQILDLVEKAKSDQERIQILQKYNSTPLRGCLNLNFNPLVKINLPEGEPPFKKDKEEPMGSSETNLYTEWRRMYIWVRPSDLPRIRRENLFIQLLEGVHWTEAEMLCLVKDRKLRERWPSIQPNLVRQAFPGLLPDGDTVDLADFSKPKPSKKKIVKEKKESGAGSTPLSADSAELKDLERQLLEQQLRARP